MKVTFRIDWRCSFALSLSVILTANRSSPQHLKNLALSTINPKTARNNRFASEADRGRCFQAAFTTSSIAALGSLPCPAQRRARPKTSASDSSRNSTSTYRYSHELWESFQDRVYRLASHTFPGAKSPDIEIQSMRGGGSNRVVGISVRTSSSQGLVPAIKNGLRRILAALDSSPYPLRPQVSRYILRIPRWGNEHMQRHIVTLNFVSTRLQVPIPTTAFYDLSSDNVLGVPYTLQTRLPGENLQFAFNQLNAAQRKDLTRKICKVILGMYESLYGDCAAVGAYDVASSTFEMRSLAIPPDPDNDGKVHSLPVDETGDTLTFIKTTFQRWKDHEGTFLRKPRAEWDRCIEMAQEMAVRGLLRANERFHLTHVDLYPRNILVNITDDSSIEITGILDWDDALFAPKYVACRAPFWLWEGEEELDEADEYGGLKQPQTPELLEIKVLFGTICRSRLLGVRI